MGKTKNSELVQLYSRLFKAFGPQKWWPAQTRFEVIVGAILTQNTNNTISPITGGFDLIK